MGWRTIGSRLGPTTFVKSLGSVVRAVEEEAREHTLRLRGAGFRPAASDFGFGAPSTTSGSARSVFGMLLLLQATLGAGVEVSFELAADRPERSAGVLVAGFESEVNDALAAGSVAGFCRAFMNAERTLLLPGWPESVAVAVFVFEAVEVAGALTAVRKKKRSFALVLVLLTAVGFKDSEARGGRRRSPAPRRLRAGEQRLHLVTRAAVYGDRLFAVADSQTGRADFG